VKCPDCLQERSISYAIYRRVTIGELSGRCLKCGIKYRDKKKLLNIKEEISEPYIRLHGCKIFKHPPMFSSKRCDHFFECVHRKDCLNTIALKKWAGFLSDSKGFEEGRKSEIKGDSFNGNRRISD